MGAILIRLWLMLIVLLFYPPWGAAEMGGKTPGEKLLTLADLEELAVQNSAGVKAADYQIKSLEYRYGEGRVTHLPEFRAAYRYNSNPVFGEVRQGYSSAEHHAEAGASFNVLKRWGLNPGEQAKIDLEIKAAREERRRAVQEAKWRAQQLYLDIQDNRLREADFRAMATLLEEAVQLAQLGQQHQEVLNLEVLKVEKNLQEVRQQVELAKKAQVDRRALLARFLGLNPATLHLAPYALQTRQIPPFDELVKQMRERNPTLAAIKMRARGAETDASYAPYNYVNMYLDAYYNVDNYRSVGARTGALLGARLEAPFAFFGLTRNRRQRSLNEAEALNYRGKAMAEAIEQDMLAALEKLRDFELRFKNTENQVKITEENARMRHLLSTQPSLAASMTRLERLEADYLVMEAKRELTAVSVEWEKAYYYLLYLAGITDGANQQPNSKEHATMSGTTAIGMWVYYPNRLMDQGKMTELLDFSKAKGITRLYLCLNYPLINTMRKYRPMLADFIRAAGRQGIEVEALLDETTFILPEKRFELDRYLEAIEAYNRAVPDAPLQAIHLDLEIHQLSGWQDRKAELARMWLETIRYVKGRALALPVVIDLPIWLARFKIPGWKEIIEAADAVVFMAYEQKTPEQLLKAFPQEWAYAGQSQKPVWIGLNLSDFSGRGEPALLTYMDEVRRQASYPMAGFALFKYLDYSRLNK